MTIWKWPGWAPALLSVTEPSSSCFWECRDLGTVPCSYRINRFGGEMGMGKKTGSLKTFISLGFLQV